MHFKASAEGYKAAAGRCKVSAKLCFRPEEVVGRTSNSGCLVNFLIVPVVLNKQLWHAGRCCMEAGGFTLINGQQQRHVPWPQRTLSEVLRRKHFWHLGGLFKAVTWSFLMFQRVFLASKSAGEEVWLEGQFEEPKENKTTRAKTQEHFITRQPFIVQPVLYRMWPVGKTFFPLQYYKELLSAYETSRYIRPT